MSEGLVDKPTRELNILVTSVPQMGHALPVIKITQYLASRGHKLTFATMDCETDMIRKLLPKTTELRLIPCEFNTVTEIDQASEQTGEFLFTIMQDVMLEPLREIISQIAPDVVVTDFLGSAAMQIAYEMDLPIVLSAPASASIISSVSGNMIDPNYHVACCGLHMGIADISKFSTAMYFNVQRSGSFLKRNRRYMGRGVYLVQSHFGIEPPRSLPCSMRIIGSLIEPPQTALANLAHQDPELWSWLEKETATPVVFVSTGSLVGLHDWQVVAIWNGLKRAGVRVVWSLKARQQEAIPNKEDESFWIRTWLRQPEIIQHPRVNVVITHCGWNSVLELTSAGKVALGLPFFGDQVDNAKLLKARGMADILGNPGFSPHPANLYKEGSITAEGVTNAVKKILDDRKYSDAAREVAKAARATGGIKQAVQEIEMAGMYGVNHQASPEYWRRTTGHHIMNLAATGCFAGVVTSFLCCLA